MNVVRALALMAVLLAGSPVVRAEVDRKAPYSFLIKHKLASTAAPADLYRALAQVERWWSSQHTFSGKSEHLHLKAEAGGCFCERWPEGSVEHGRVIQTKKDRLLRLQAPLGPLLELPVSAVLTFALEPKGTGSELLVTYWVSGDMTLPVGKWAAPSDQVLGAQLSRLIRFAETGKPE